MTPRYPAFAFAALFLLTGIASARAQTITEYPAPAGGVPYNMARGADQNLWFTDQQLDSIVQMTPTGATTSFFIPTAGSLPTGIVAGPDGNLWFTEFTGNNIGRLTTTGTFTEYPIPTLASGAGNITTGPDGNVWFVEQNGGNVGQITADGIITEFPVPTSNPDVNAIAFGPDGNMWFTEQAANKIGRITTAGAITEFPVTTGSTTPHGIVGGFDGNIWFIEGSSNKIAQMSTAGVVLHEYPIPTANSGSVHLRRGIDGSLWFSENNVSQIGQITMAGTITEYLTPTANSGPWGLAVGPEGAIWFAESNSNAIGQLFPVTNGQLLVSAVLPSSQSVTLPTAATAFATILNAGTATATSCAISPIDGVAQSFGYQTANNLNELIGTPNTPADIPPNGAQNFVITLTPNAVFVPETINFAFFCSNANAAALTPGVNTFIMSASATPVPNIIALAATPSGGGILDIPGTTGSAAFVVASVNLGAGASIKVVAGTGDAALPLTLQVCETNPVTGACLATPSSSVTTTIAADATPTFGIFATGTGTIPFAPAINRINVRFLDADNVNRGETSVAVQTQ